MSQFVDVTLIILDVNRTPLKGVKVKTNYQGGRAYSERTSDSTGMVTLPVSPNRVFEIHVINPEGQYEFNVALNSNKASIKPQKIVVSRTIDEYQKSTSPKSGLISFHVVMHDANNKKVKNFPCKTRYVGGSRFGEKYTNTEGTFSVPAKPNRLVEIYILQPDDSFVLQSTVNSGAGDNVVNIKLNHSIYTYMTTTELHIKDIDGSDFYPNAKLYLKYLNSEALIEGEKTKTGKLVLKGIIGEPMVLTLLKPDNKKMKPVTYISKRIKNKILTLKMPVNLVHGTTAEGEPEVDTAVTGLCACNRDITESEFKVITKSSTALSFLSDLNDQFKKLKMNNCLEKAHFIAHTLHETASYSLLEEGLPKGVQEKDVYDGYKGRGLMQITYKTNYEGYGAAVGENFTGNNKFRIAKERKHAVGSAIWYWHHSKAGNLSTYALKNDLIATTALINGGYNGFNDREHYYKKAVEAFKVKDCQNLDRAIINRLPAYCPFEESYIYQNKAGESFGWGLWNDPNGRKKGKTSDLIQMKKGYERFLEMSKNVSYPFGKTKDSQENTISRKRYGYTSDKAKQLAEKRLGDL